MNSYILPLVTALPSGTRPSSKQSALSEDVCVNAIAIWFVNELV